jgi:hypothetical protein
MVRHTGAIPCMFCPPKGAHRETSPIRKQQQVGCFRSISFGHEQRELDTGRSSIEGENHITHRCAFRLLCLLCATNRASAQEAIYARGLSAQLVSMIGTHAPNTMPASSAKERLENVFQEVWMMEINKQSFLIRLYQARLHCSHGILYHRPSPIIRHRKNFCHSSKQLEGGENITSKPWPNKCR